MNQAARLRPARPRRTLPSAALILLAVCAALGWTPPAHAAVSCSAISCQGKYSELVEFLYTLHEGTVRIRVTQPVIDSLSETGLCTLESGKYIKIPAPDGDGGEESQLAQLYLSYAFDGHLLLRPRADADGECEVAYILALYPE